MFMQYLKQQKIKQFYFYLMFVVFQVSKYLKAQIFKTAKHTA